MLEFGPRELEIMHSYAGQNHFLRVRHIPTGVFVEIEEPRLYQARDKALELLREKLKEFEESKKRK